MSCGGLLAKRSRSQVTASGCLAGLGFVLMGLGVFILIPVIGWVVGPIIILIGTAMGSKKPEKIWRCRNCKMTFRR